MAMITDRLRRTLTKLVIPTGDLGLSQGDVPPLAVLDDIDVGLALSTVQTPAGPRIQQANNNGVTGVELASPQRIIRSQTEAAGNTQTLSMTGFANCLLLIEVLALNGAPTNITYRCAISLDGGTTWYNGGAATTTGTGLVILRYGPFGNAVGVGGAVVASNNWPSPIYDLFRAEWAFSGGASPTVQHRIWRLDY